MTSYDKKLIQCFSALSDGHKELVLEFMEFLGSKYPNTSQFESPVEVRNEPEKILEPILTPRPESESVIAAIKRLSQSYPMLNKENLFDKTSLLMTAHIMQGRDVVEVIDEIELVFKDQYEDHINSKK
ncbi:MAG: Crp/Fnr family transcriptional regulator [Gammaproteobacteria bacterium]|nr:Crp/Fnr family transcriptional regulator [Gammaproteobacteria bacterium]MCK5091912.1 Crp/Fnr family transcriptional regulator [Gammaproteobacteria bacterium]